MAAFYGFNHLEVDDMPNEVVSMYLRELPYIRYLRDFSMLRYAFSKYGEDDRKKMLEPATGPDDISTRAWREYVKPYEVGGDEPAEEVKPLGISPVTAEAIVSWIEKGELSLSPHGADVWRIYVHPLWKRLLATLKQN